MFILNKSNIKKTLQGKLTDVFPCGVSDHADTKRIRKYVNSHPDLSIVTEAVKAKKPAPKPEVKSTPAPTPIPTTISKPVEKKEEAKTGSQNLFSSKSSSFKKTGTGKGKGKNKSS